MRKPSPEKSRETTWRQKAGFPPLVCPACFHDGQHWVPDSLRGPGYFTCEVREEPDALSALFELETDA